MEKNGVDDCSLRGPSGIGGTVGGSFGSHRMALWRSRRWDMGIRGDFGLFNPISELNLDVDDIKTVRGSPLNLELLANGAQLDPACSIKNHRS